MGKVTGVSDFIDGHLRRELVQGSAGVGNVRSHCDREFIGEGLADSGSRGDGRSGGKGDESGSQEGGYCELHREWLIGERDCRGDGEEELEVIVVMRIVSGIGVLYISTREVAFRAISLKKSTKRGSCTTQPCHLTN